MVTLDSGAVYARHSSHLQRRVPKPVIQPISRKEKFEGSNCRNGTETAGVDLPHVIVESGSPCKVNCRRQAVSEVFEATPTNVGRNF